MMENTTEKLPNPGETRMKLHYGVNEADSWWHFAVGPQRERIWARLRAIDLGEV